MNKVLNKLSFTVLFISLSAISTFAQHQINGDTKALDDDCFELTPEKDGKTGSVWFTPMINLDKSFDFTFDINFGCNKKGADGMSFSLSNDKYALGGGGAGQGFVYLWDSFNIEFDHFSNDMEHDPKYDHIAMFKHGKTDHNDEFNVAGPVQINPSKKNIKDCNFHEIRIRWDTYSNTMSVYFECELRLSYTGDIVGEIFDGDPNVYWGFTASTGANNNAQFACLKDIRIVDPLEDYTMCPGGKIQLDADENGTMYNWSPAESLSDASIRNPLAFPETNTTYSVTVSDNCVEYIDTIRIDISGDSLSLQLSDSTLCAGDKIILDVYTEDAIYNWSNGETTSSISPASTGYYTVTVTHDSQCSTNDAALINFISLPETIATDYTTVCPGESILLDPSLASATYLWQDGSTDSTYLVTKAGSYSVMMEHFCGDKKININIGFDPSCIDVYIPNAFSPNDDGRNDSFVILGGSDITVINQFTVTDRWGTILFHQNNFPANDENFAWNGKFKGEHLSTGVYFYLAEITFRDGTSSIIKGNVTLFR